MKHKFLNLALVVMAATLVGTACSDNNDVMDKPEPDTKTTITYRVTTDELSVIADVTAWYTDADGETKEEKITTTEVWTKVITTEKEGPAEATLKITATRNEAELTQETYLLSKTLSIGYENPKGVSAKDKTVSSSIKAENIGKYFENSVESTLTANRPN